MKHFLSSNKGLRMEKRMIRLTKEKETLLVPLYSKAIENKKENPILVDPKASEILESIDYDFYELKIPRQSLLTLAMRAKKLDAIVVRYMQENKYPVVLHLGCGLDSRVLRTKFIYGQWYDLDYPDVIDLRKSFYSETNNYHMISSSVTDYSWISSIEYQKNVCIIAEGLFMYLQELDVRNLILALQKQFPESILAFDAYSKLTAKSVGNHPSIKKTGAQVQWGIDDGKEIELWGTGSKLLEEWYFTDSDDISSLRIGSRMLFRMAGMFTAAKKAHRILKYAI
jgi:O-methyltransferase involved in polyketide biosynthesis